VSSRRPAPPLGRLAAAGCAGRVNRFLAGVARPSLQQNESEYRISFTVILLV
jgi:hypothetical protein